MKPKTTTSFAYLQVLFLPYILFVFPSNLSPNIAFFTFELLIIVFVMFRYEYRKVRRYLPFLKNLEGYRHTYLDHYIDTIPKPTSELHNLATMATIQMLKVSYPLTQQEIYYSTLWEVLKEPLNQKRKILYVLLSSSAVARTALLTEISLVFARDQAYRYELDARLPVLLQLADVRDLICSTEPPPLHVLLRMQYTHKPNFPPPARFWFEDQLNKSRCIMLLDLPDAADQAEQERLVNWILHQIQYYPNAVWLVACSSQTYATTTIGKVPALDLEAHTTLATPESERPHQIAKTTQPLPDVEPESVPAAHVEKKLDPIAPECPLGQRLAKLQQHTSIVVDPQPITLEEWQQFSANLMTDSATSDLDLLLAKVIAEYLESILVAEGPHAPVRGIPFYLAAGFCDWLSEHTPDSYTFRLPELGELDQALLTSYATPFALWYKNEEALGAAGLDSSQQKKVLKLLQAHYPQVQRLISSGLSETIKTVGPDFEKLDLQPWMFWNLLRALRINPIRDVGFSAFSVWRNARKLNFDSLDEREAVVSVVEFYVHRCMLIFAKKIDHRQRRSSLKKYVQKHKWAELEAQLQTLPSTKDPIEQIQRHILSQLAQLRLTIKPLLNLQPDDLASARTLFTQYFDLAIPFLENLLSLLEHTRKRAPRALGIVRVNPENYTLLYELLLLMYTELATLRLKSTQKIPAYEGMIIVQERKQTS